MSLDTYEHYHSETLFTFTIFVSMSRRRPIYVLSTRSIFHFHLHFHRRTSSLTYFLEYVLLLLDDNMDKKCEQSSNSKT